MHHPIYKDVVGERGVPGTRQCRSTPAELSRRTSSCSTSQGSPFNTPRTTRRFISCDRELLSKNYPRGNTALPLKLAYRQGPSYASDTAYHRGQPRTSIGEGVTWMADSGSLLISKWSSDDMLVANSQISKPYGPSNILQTGTHNNNRQRPFRGSHY